jgi:hypothetical protein
LGFWIVVLPDESIGLVTRSRTWVNEALYC